MSKEIPIRAHLADVFLEVTRRCNLACAHCFQGPAKDQDLSLADLGLLLEHTFNPYLGDVCLSGGEPRYHPEFPKIGPFIRQFLHDHGGALTDDLRSDRRFWDINFGRAYKSLVGLPSQKQEHYMQTGEDYFFLIRDAAEGTNWPSKRLKLSVITNGSGIETRPQCTSVIWELYRQGFSEISISTDRAHRQSARQQEIRIAYDLLDELVRDYPGTSKRLQLPPSIILGLFPSNPYAFPVGRAATLPKQARFLLSGAPTNSDSNTILNNTERIKQTERRLAEEFELWEIIFNDPTIELDGENRAMTHCYCPTARFYRQAEQMLKFDPKNRFHLWKVYVNTNLSASLCVFHFLPSLGDLHEIDAQEIYRRALSSKLIEIIGHYGPQGVARLVTGFSDQQLKEMYIEKTPCGLCAYLGENHQSELAQLSVMASNFGQG